MIKIHIARLATRHGLKTAYALQKALDISPTMAARLWKGDFDKIGIGTIDKLCERFNCQPDAFLEYDITNKKLAQVMQLGNTELSNNTQSSKNVARPTQLSNTELRNDTQTGNTQSSNESDNDRLLSTVEVAERLGVSRKSVNDYIIDGKLPAVKGKQNHNFVKFSDILIYESVHGAKG